MRKIYVTVFLAFMDFSDWVQPLDK